MGDSNGGADLGCEFRRANYRGSVLFEPLRRLGTLRYCTGWCNGLDLESATSH